MAPVNVLRLYKSKCIGRCQASAEQRIQAAHAVFAEAAAHLEAQYSVSMKPSTCAVARNLFAETYRAGALVATVAVLGEPDDVPAGGAVHGAFPEPQSGTRAARVPRHA